MYLRVFLLHFLLFSCIVLESHMLSSWCFVFVFIYMWESVMFYVQYRPFTVKSDLSSGFLVYNLYYYGDYQYTLNEKFDYGNSSCLVY